MLLLKVQLRNSSGVYLLQPFTGKTAILTRLHIEDILNCLTIDYRGSYREMCASACVLRCIQRGKYLFI